MGAAGSVMGNKCAKNDKQEKKNHKEYSVGPFIAEGVSGKVYHGKRLADGTEVALKFFGYCKNYDAKFEDIRKELDAMIAVRGVEGLVQVEGFFMDTKKGLLPDKVDCQGYPVIIMELLAGGPLFGRINYRDSISEKFICHVFKKMIYALRSLHQRNVIHRDLKLDNVMFLEKSYDSPVKIIDLGNIIELENSEFVFKDIRVVGTPGYLAPETISNKEYSKKSDIWQAGCTLYSLLSGLPPFDPNSYKQVTDLSYFPMTGPAWDDVSSTAKSLVSKMLKKNPDHRINVDEVLEHAWLVDEVPDKEFNRDYFTRIKHLALRNKMKNFFLESELLEGHKKRKKSLRNALPIFRQASDLAQMSKAEFQELDQGEVHEVRNDVEVFRSKVKLLKNMVVKSISGNLSEQKEIDYESFTKMLKECQLQELCSLHVFNIFDIGNTGTIDPREFLLTMLAFRTEENPHFADALRGNAKTDGTDSNRIGEQDDDVTVSGIEVTKSGEVCDNEDEIRLFFNVFDINETGYIDLEELKIAVNFLLYMGSDQPQTLPNIHELFSTIDTSQNGQIDYSEFKHFYRHLIASNMSLTNYKK